MFNRKLWSFVLVLTLLITTFSTAIPSNALAGQSKTAMQSYVEAMQPGWNLGNTFDATGEEESWGNPRTTKALIDQIAAQGYKSIRIPITWKHRMGDAPDYTIEASFLDRIQEVIDWSLDAGLYVMINLHHDSGWWVINMETEHDEVLGRFQSLWTQISDRFKDYPQKLMFESINEPRFSDDWNKDTPEYFEMLDELNTSFFQIVRASGGSNATRPLVLPSLTASGSQIRLDELSKTIANLNDDNIIATIHYYGFWPFSVNIAGVTTFNQEVRNDIIQTFDRAYNTFVAKGIPVIVGEFGLLGFDKSLGTIQHGEMLKFFEFLTYYAKEKSLTHMLWDNGQHFDRRAGKWSDPDLHQVMAASIQGRSSTAQSDSIYMKKDAVVTDVNIPLHLNGNMFLDLKHGETTLIRGTDYDIAGDQLTIKSALLQSLITRQYGTNATLTAKFSSGADWRFNVIYYDTPKLFSITGTSNAFAIPTMFNGDNLATMEATYTSGGNAGPQDWTPFKEFNYTFSPSYGTNEIKLTKEFFNEVRDGEILLKMHFWSGNIIEYKITKAQNTIVGVSSEEPLAEGAPGKPELSDNNGHANGLQDGNYTVTMNMWHGNNGSVFKLYENGVLISTRLLTDASPTAQSVAVEIAGKPNGSYTYIGELTNVFGTTVSDPLVIVIKDANPGKPVLSHDNWDGDGNYNLMMNMWWGTNATEYRLYENEQLIDAKSLHEATPEAQSMVTNIADRAIGTYTYRCELANAAGVTSSETITVVVRK